jgi:hypothetical protein
MTNKEQITELSWNTNDLLSQYVAIHDDVFKTLLKAGVLHPPFHFPLVKNTYGKQGNLTPSPLT